jgi:hypothetical protein
MELQGAGVRWVRQGVGVGQSRHCHSSLIGGQVGSPGLFTHHQPEVTIGARHHHRPSLGSLKTHEAPVGGCPAPLSVIREQLVEPGRARGLGLSLTRALQRSLLTFLGPSCGRGRVGTCTPSMMALSSNSEFECESCCEYVAAHGRARNRATLIRDDSSCPAPSLAPDWLVRRLDNQTERHALMSIPGCVLLEEKPAAISNNPTVTVCRPPAKQVTTLRHSHPSFTHPSHCTIPIPKFVPRSTKHLPQPKRAGPA